MTTQTAKTTTLRLSGSGAGPSITELEDFVRDLSNKIGRVELSVTPGDRPFDSPTWAIEATYKETSNG